MRDAFPTWNWFDGDGPDGLNPGETGVLLLRRSALLLLAAPAWMPASALPGSPRFAGKYDDPDYPGALALREGIVPVIRMMGCWWTSHPEDQSFIRWIEQTCSC
ncbi:unnamed protein product [Durusdinium trenchii]|uniref:Uncharacterized protein n=1 Tax=Durusdinium trenchii TaxID=1381693 RepID=A0ABP0MNR5_9DINO